VQWGSIEIMGQRTRFSWFSFHLLLIATMVQGIAPDAHNLASLKGLHLLASTLGHVSIPEGDEASTDEVCGSAQVKPSRFVGECDERSPAALPGSAGTRGGITESAALRRANSRRDVPWIEDLVHSHCRLTC
jgi:hypothetical protein